MVDWDGLENRSRCKPTVGSNPTPSVSWRAFNAPPKRSEDSSLPVELKISIEVLVFMSMSCLR